MTINTISVLSDMRGLDRALADSLDRPILLVKHSPACGISAQAYDEIESLRAVGFLAEMYLMDVRTARSVSNAIATRLHVRHESPQALLVQGGRVQWVASHFHVTAHEIRSALAAVAR